jgi:hypothetical protein
MPGEQSTVVLGWEADIEINGIAFGVRGGTVTDRADSHECGDTVSGIVKVQKGGRRQFEMDVDFFEKDDLNVHDPHGLNLIPGQYVSVVLHPKGTGSPDDPYINDDFLCEVGTTSFEIDGKVQGKLSGKSSGDYNMPSGDLASFNF